MAIAVTVTVTLGRTSGANVLTRDFCQLDHERRTRRHTQQHETSAKWRVQSHKVGNCVSQEWNQNEVRDQSACYPVAVAQPANELLDRGAESDRKHASHAENQSCSIQQAEQHS